MSQRSHAWRGVTTCTPTPPHSIYRQPPVWIGYYNVLIPLWDDWGWTSGRTAVPPAARHNCWSDAEIVTADQGVDVLTAGSSSSWVAVAGGGSSREPRVVQCSSIRELAASHIHTRTLSEWAQSATCQTSIVLSVEDYQWTPPFFNFYIRIKLTAWAYGVNVMNKLTFYPRDAIIARVIVIATCLSVRPSRAGIVWNEDKRPSCR